VQTVFEEILFDMYILKQMDNERDGKAQILFHMYILKQMDDERDGKASNNEFKIYAFKL